MWNIWTRYEGDTEWEIELVPEQYRTESVTTFEHWWQVNLWFGQLQKDLTDLTTLNAGIQFFIVPLPADGANEQDSTTTATDSLSTTTQ